MTVQPAAVRLWLLARRWRTGRRRVLLVAACATLGSIFLLWNLPASPDTQYDEVVYSRADQAVAENWQLTWTNRPLFVHPPLSFLLQAAWLRALGVAHQPLIEVITSTRLLAGLASVVNVVLIALLAHRLMPWARPRTRTVLTLLTALLAATDPLLVRYGRMAMIEPFALLSCLVALHLALRLRNRRASVFVPVIGLATGLSLLTNEICIFMLLTPLVYALIDRNRTLVRRSAAALAVGLVLWSVFLVWSIQLGLFGSFVDVKTVTLQRLLGTVQITGWNRPGVSFMDGLLTQMGQYLSSYVVLGVGALALVFLILHHGGTTHRWLLAWLITSYAFGAYTVLLGTINEQFFVYVVPAPLVASVLLAEAVFGHRTRLTVGALLVAASVLGLSVVSWVQYSTTRNDGLARLTAYAGANLPSCAVLNTTGDIEHFQLLMPDRPMAVYATGPAALSHGVNLFVLSDKDAQMRFGNASPALNSWVRAHGNRLAAYPSATYRGLELWQVPMGAYDPAAGVERMPGGDFVMTESSRCGGYPVVDADGGRFATGWAALGGKAVTGAPLTAAWPGHQVFEGAVLLDGATTLPVVAQLAAHDPVGYRAAGLPPVTGPAGTDPAFQGREALLGRPLGPPQRMADGMIRQAFAGGVLEHAPDSASVRLAPIGRMLLDAGIVKPPAAARAPAVAPALPMETESTQPSTVEPFFWTLAAAMVLYAGFFAVVLARRAARTAAVAASPSPAIGMAPVPGAGQETAIIPRIDPALGAMRPVRRRKLVARMSVLILLPVAGLGLRASGIMHPKPSALPALPYAERVVPGVVSTGQPGEADLARVHDDYGVRAVIAINGRDDSTFSAVEEEAVAGGLGMGYLRLTVHDGRPLTPDQVASIGDLLRRVRPSERTAPSLVLIHDYTGDGPVRLVSAVIRILDRQPPAEVLDWAPLDGGQRAALLQLAESVNGSVKPDNPYSSLQHRDW